MVCSCSIFNKTLLCGSHPWNYQKLPIVTWVLQRNILVWSIQIYRKRCVKQGWYRWPLPARAPGKLMVSFQPRLQSWEWKRTQSKPWLKFEPRGLSPLICKNEEIRCVSQNKENKFSLLWLLSSYRTSDGWRMPIDTGKTDLYQVYYLLEISQTHSEIIFSSYLGILSHLGKLT